MNRMQELVKKLIEASYAYYALDKPIMSDWEYDKLYDELEALEQKTGVVLAGSPTQKVQGFLMNGFNKVVHSKPMLSAAKSKNIEDVRKFLGDNEWYCSGKLDGLTLVLRFSGGKLVQGITRGDGTVGEDVTEACRFIKNIPIRIPYEDDLEVRGECVMSWKEFNRVNETLTEKYSHPRNLAAGTLRQLDLNIVKERGLSFVAFECVTPLTDSKAEDLHWLSFYQGFETVIRRVSSNHKPYADNYLRGKDETLERTVDFMTLETRTDKYPYDGLVFEIDSRKVSDKLGTTAHHPNCRFALKWADETKETVLRDVEWNVGKTGVLFPTAVVDPVELDGAVTQKVTLNNVSYIRDLELGIGDTVTIYRSNQVIPCLDDNLTRSNTLELPKVCPECGSPVKLVKENDSEMLYCTNPNCKGILLGKLKHFVSRAGLNIEGLSEQTLKTLVNMGAVNSFEDIFKLKTWKIRLSSVPGFGAKSIDKLLKSIDEASKHVDLAHFISALSIAGIGLAQGKVLAQTFGTWAKFYECATNKYDFTSIDGIGSVLSKNIHKYFAQNKDIDMLTAYLTFADDEPKKSEGGEKLKGLTFVVTGKVYTFKNRNELSDKIQSLGGHVASSVTTKTNFLINNDATSGSTKNKKAHELGVKIITEDEFLEMIR